MMVIRAVLGPPLVEVLVYMDQEVELVETSPYLVTFLYTEQVEQALQDKGIRADQIQDTAQAVAVEPGRQVAQVVGLVESAELALVQ
jgi:hypothetical protein